MSRKFFRRGRADLERFLEPAGESFGGLAFEGIHSMGRIDRTIFTTLRSDLLPQLLEIFVGVA